DSVIEKRGIITNWILENVFLEAYFTVKNKLILENEELPYNIEYKLNNSYDVLMENFNTMAVSTAGALLGVGALTYGSGFLIPYLGLGLTVFSIILGLSDSDRKAIIKTFKSIGDIIGKIVTFDYDLYGIETKKEINAIVKSMKEADPIKECIKIVGWDPTGSNKITRFVEKLFNTHKEHEYAECIGTKLIKFYVSSLEILYKIISSSDLDDKVFDTMENGLKRGLLNEIVFRNMARLTKNKHVFKLIEVLNKTTKRINLLIDTFANSKEPEYVTIGHNLSKMLDSELRELAFKIHKDRAKKLPRSPLNRRPGGIEIMKDKNGRISSGRNDRRDRNDRNDRRDRNDRNDRRDRNDRNDRSDNRNSRDRNRNPF
ncbi:MAG TPA: hypothetical protein EYG89_02745, partial [Bacteroidia bacterium]|nr:hypothetical protein [Bacteroidia bacterium]